MCSVPARGLWIDMLGFMHQAQPYGHLVFNGRSIDAKKLASMVGAPTKSVAKWLKELKDNGVYSIDDNGVIYSRRMVRDELKREAWRLEKQRQRGGQPTDNRPDTTTDKVADTPPLSSDLSATSPVVVRSSVVRSSLPAVTSGEENTSNSRAHGDNPVERKPTSTPTARGYQPWGGAIPPQGREQADARVERTQAQLEEQRQAAAKAAPMPDAIKPKRRPATFDDLDDTPTP